MHFPVNSATMPRRAPGPNFSRLIALLLALSTGVLFVVAGCSRPSGPTAPAVLSAVDPRFAGNAACAPCHAAEFREHVRSRHATTLHSADRRSLGALMPPIGAVPLAGYALEEEQSGLALARRAVTPVQLQPVRLVLGSGKVGMTYVTPVGGDALLETKMSYFPSLQIWDTTPGQEVHVPGDTVFGRVHTGSAARHCIECHSTALPANGLMPDPAFFGVGCESCHGPGKAHITAMRAGDHANLHMENLGAWTPTRLNNLCGKCHRTVQNVDVESPEVDLTHRFQPYALLRSACRKPGGEPLSCLDCHNPHADASADNRVYEANCLTCHSVEKARRAATHSAGMAIRSCPVNSKTGCIACHMRSKRAFSLTSIKATMVDHLISVPRKQQ